MGRKKTDLEDRILASASRLFYKEGYCNTGIVKIIEEANTNKPTFYRYFESKESLAKRYLQLKASQAEELVSKIAADSKNINEFFNKWLSVSLRNASFEGRHLGCPVLNFSAQIQSKDSELDEVIVKISRRWIAGLSLYVSSEIKKGRLETDLSPREFARRMFLLYQGAHSMARISGRDSYIKTAVRMFQAMCRQS